MSKAMVLALGITETASFSYRSTGKKMLNKNLWIEIFRSHDFHRLVSQNIKPAKTFFSVRRSVPALADFEDVSDEFVSCLDEFMRWGSVRAFFALIEAERELEGRVPDDYFSETAFDYVLEDCHEFLSM